MKVPASKFASASLPNNKYKNRLVNILPCKFLTLVAFSYVFQLYRNRFCHECGMQVLINTVENYHLTSKVNCHVFIDHPVGLYCYRLRVKNAEYL